MSEPEFDALRVPTDLPKLDMWLKRNHPGLSPSTPRIWREWWSVRELVRRQDAADPVIARGDLIIRADRGEGRGQPDFILRQSERDDALEVTIAGTTADVAEINASRRTGAATALIGEAGGRFVDGVVGDEWEAAMAEDIIRAANAKSAKPYAPGGILLIHCHSNAMMADPAGVAAHLAPHGGALPFREVVALAPGGCLIRWRADQVSIQDRIRSARPRP
ncbi:hypothetical protein [Albimonas donghaensis]|uniref:hypothetical protein n=1 Tax=Albimonas donghaensis TaxID=356660 RepID=UPI000A9BC8BF|nr:hypothetical protein [Albimonas donghaensis]